MEKLIKINGVSCKSLIEIGFNSINVTIVAKNRIGQRIEILNTSPYIYDEVIKDNIVSFVVNTSYLRNMNNTIRHIEDNISFIYSVNFKAENEYISEEIYRALE